MRVADLPSLRPTLGRVRETLFNWLQGEVANARVLDLFAGSGALGFEALSRGAAQVTFVDSHAKVAAQLRATASTLDLDDAMAVIRKEPAGRWMRRPPEAPYDLVFLDPPFGEAKQLLPQILACLSDPNWLAADGALYVELPLRDPAPLDHWAESHGFVIDRDKRAGECRFLLLRRRA